MGDTITDQLDELEKSADNFANEIVNTFKEMEESDKWEKFSRIVGCTYKRLHLDAPCMDIYKSMERQAAQKIKLFGIYDINNTLVSARLVICHNKLAYCQILGSLAEYSKFHPNEFSYHETIFWAKENGFSILDMGGGGNPDKPYGVRDFKMGFGPQAFNYGHYVLPLRPALMKIAKKTWYFLHRR